MRLILILTAISSVFYASFSVADDWDDKTAYQLAIASYCAYGVSKDDPKSNKSAVKACLQAAVKQAKDKGSNVLDVFNQLPDNAVEIFKTSGEVTHESINAAILLKINGGAIVAFRGTTESPWDWLHNIFLTRIGEGYVGGRHFGFNQSLDTLKAEIISKSDIWKSFENKSGETLYITGHSKGGALATGATVDFEKKFKGKIVTYTFEAARFFTAKGINNKDDENDINNKPLLDKIWRFEYLYDVVPHVPLGKITQDYLLEYKKDHEFIVELFERTFRLPKDWIENNNITFVPAGKLRYVGIGDDGKLKDQQQPDLSEQDHYQKRFVASLEEMRNNLLHLKDFVIQQHSNCYLYYLEAKTTNASLNLENQPRCF